MLWNANKLKGLHLGAIDGELGRVKDFYFDDEDWKVRYAVVDTGGWLPKRKVLLAPYALGAIEEDHKLLHVQLTKEQIEKSPPIDSDKPVSRQFEHEYYRYYGWPYYWQDPALWGTAPANLPPVVEPNTDTVAVEEGDPHLRSTNEVAGYHIQARDGEVGHVDDFILDDQNWSVRYLVVDTRNWLPGKHVLVSPLWIDQISWEQSKVFVDLQRQPIEGAPEYDPHKPLTREYEQQLFQTHDRLPYWP
jgi:uncharacterized protein YrrD